MNQSEYNELRELRQRLYGGPLDGEPGDIVILKHDVADIRNTLKRWDGAITFIKVASGFLSFGGLAIILRAIVGG